MTTPRYNEPLSLQELRRVIGFRAGWKSLRRNLEARELVTGQRIIVRYPGRAGYRFVTLSALAKYAPDLLPPEMRGALVGPAADARELRMARRILKTMDERVEALVAEGLAKVSDRVAKLERIIEDAIEADRRG